MQQSGVERRRGRRMSFEAPLLIRHLSAEESHPFKERVTKNVSLAGVYFECEIGDATPYAVDHVVVTSVLIPEPQRRQFPFTRLAGRGRVVRVTEFPHGTAGTSRRVGVAVEFGDDVLALTTIPPRG